MDLQKNTSTQDPNTGEEVRAWTTYATVWAEIAPLSARDFISAQAIQAEIKARIVIRYRDDVLAEHRVKHGGVIYRVVGALPDKSSGRQYLTLVVAEGVSVDGT